LIPPGHVLVITDIEWDMNAVPAAGTTVDVFVQLTSPGNLTNEAYRARVAVEAQMVTILREADEKPVPEVAK
jgi:hypothetical protein